MALQSLPTKAQRSGNRESIRYIVVLSLNQRTMSDLSKVAGELFVAQGLPFSEHQEVIGGQYKTDSTSHTSLNPALVFFLDKSRGGAVRASEWKREQGAADETPRTWH